MTLTISRSLRAILIIKRQIKYHSAGRFCDSCRVEIIPAGNLPTFMSGLKRRDRSPTAAVIFTRVPSFGSFVNRVGIDYGPQAHFVVSVPM